MSITIRSRALPVSFVLLFATLSSAYIRAQETSHLQPAKSSAAKAPVRVSAGTQLLFGTFPLSTKSAAARAHVEIALDEYENASFEEAIKHAQLATQKDPTFALGYALWSFVARRSELAPEALEKAKSLSAKCVGDECLLVRFLIGTQEANVLPAISAMNDLVAHRSKDKHVLYLAGEWVFFQQDYDHATKLWLKSLAIDPDFPAALNMLGYVYVEGDEPDPAKAVDYLRHYAAVQPDQANPQDSLGEVLRIAGDDGGSLAHYAESLRIDPKMITSQYGRGDTYALMGDWMKANTEYKKALQLSMNVRDTQHILFQSAMLHFWIGDVAGGREALAMLSEKVTEANNASAQFEIDYARAILAPDLATEHRLLQSLEGSLAEVRPGILESDRNSALASVLREEIRVAVAANQPQDASAAALKLQQLAESSRNQLIENVYESALGYVSLGGGDYAKAAQQLSADLHSPQVLRDYLRAQEKLADTKSLDTARRRLQYLRAPTADWFLVSHDTTLTSQQVAP